MIADDRESMRSALRSLLVLRPGWVVCGEAETAKEAITKAAELRPDLIVLDYKLQTSDGIAAADGLLRSEEHTSELQSHLNLVCRLLLEKKKRLHNKHTRDTTSAAI